MSTSVRFNGYAIKKTTTQKHVRSSSLPLWYEKFLLSICMIWCASSSKIQKHLAMKRLAVWECTRLRYARRAMMFSFLFFPSIYLLLFFMKNQILIVCMTPRVSEPKRGKSLAMGLCLKTVHRAYMIQIAK
jgi:hypothetical protein